MPQLRVISLGDSFPSADRLIDVEGHELILASNVDHVYQRVALSDVLRYGHLAFLDAENEVDALGCLEIDCSACCLDVQLPFSISHVSHFSFLRLVLLSFNFIIGLTTFAGGLLDFFVRAWFPIFGL